MKTYEQIARETGASVQDVRRAMNAVEKDRITRTYCFRGRLLATYDDIWFVNSKHGIGCAYKLDRYAMSCGQGKTREEAVIDALTRNPASIA